MTSRTIALASVFAAALYAGSPALAEHSARKGMCARVESARAQGKSDPEIAKSLKLSEARVKGCTKMAAKPVNAANPSTK